MLGRRNPTLTCLLDLQLPGVGTWGKSLRLGFALCTAGLGNQSSGEGCAR